MCPAKLLLYGVWGVGGQPTAPQPAALPLAAQVQVPSLLFQPVPSICTSSSGPRHHLFSHWSLGWWGQEVLGVRLWDLSGDALKQYSHLCNLLLGPSPSALPCLPQSSPWSDLQSSWMVSQGRSSPARGHLGAGVGAVPHFLSCRMAENCLGSSGNSSPSCSCLNPLPSSSSPLPWLKQALPDAFCRDLSRARYPLMYP